MFVVVQYSRSSPSISWLSLMLVVLPPVINNDDDDDDDDVHVSFAVFGCRSVRSFFRSFVRSFVPSVVPSFVCCL
jgi:hypothetical protein